MDIVSWRIGYAFSIPFGPLTMKLAETPSSNAGLIISVFGGPSSPMALLVAFRRCGTALLNGWKRGASVEASAASVKDQAGLTTDCHILQRPAPAASCRGAGGGAEALSCRAQSSID